MTRCELLAGPAPADLSNMTFPAYRHLLQLEPALRLEFEPGQPVIQPVAAVARDDSSSAIGLALAELPTAGGGIPELLSLFVARPHRGHGVGTDLLAFLEERLAARGVDRLCAVYTVGKPGVAALERVLQKLGWQPPAPRTLSVRVATEQALKVPWVGRLRLRSGCEIFSWMELTAEERERLYRSQQETHWIAEDLVPWRFDEHGFEPATSVGMRCGRDVVAWVLNHQTSPTTLRFTCSYIRKDLGRRGRILPLFSESIRRMAEAGFTECTFVTPLHHATMVAFIQRHIQPWAGSVWQTYGSEKELKPSKETPAVHTAAAGSPTTGSEPAIGSTVDPAHQGTGSGM